MPLFLSHISLDDYFYSAERKTIINRYHYLDMNAEAISQMLYSITEDQISIIPKCECGHFKGAWRLGQECPKCHTTVIEEFNNIKPMLWIEQYREDLPFINPHFWGMVKNVIYSERSKNKKFDALQWLANTQYNRPLKGTKGTIEYLLKGAEAAIGGRGYKNLITHIPELLNYLSTSSYIRNTNKQQIVKELMNVYEKDKTVIFSRYLPLPNKRMFVVERTNKGDYTTPMLADIINVAHTAMRLSALPKDSKRVENGTAKIISLISELFDNYVKMKIVAKKGLVRRNIYGTRSHFTFRTVISSLPTKYEYDELHVPWIIGPSVFRPHLMSLLVNRYNYTVKQASKRIFDSANKYDPFIAELLQTLIDENPHKGIPVLFLRNPSLLQGSVQLFYITKFKDDIGDMTTAMSVQLMKACQGDVDGDMLNATIIMDEKMHELAKTFSAHYNCVELDYFKINKYAYLPPTITPTLTNWLIDGVGEPDLDLTKSKDEVLEKMLQLQGR